METKIQFNPPVAARDGETLESILRETGEYFRSYWKFSTPIRRFLRSITVAGNRASDIKNIIDKQLLNCATNYKTKLVDERERETVCKAFSNLDFEVAIFSSHFEPDEIHDGIESGKLLQGSYAASRENYLEGFVNVEGRKKSILLQGLGSLNRAVDGDIVAVKLFDKSAWVAPSEIIIQDDEEDPGIVLYRAYSSEKKEITGEKQPTGKVVGIIHRNWGQYRGILQVHTTADSTQQHIFVPDEKKIPRVLIETPISEELKTQRIIIAIDQWPRHSRYPKGRVVHALGPLGRKDIENEILLLEHDVPHCEFSKEVLNFLPTLPRAITDEDVEKRVDLRDITICSVDPPGCTDIDDALHCKELPNGNFDVGVHIADVSHFIRPGNALDKEAASRATTVYLADKRIDMVPELLSNLCSLRGGEERFAFSYVWEIDEHANIIKTKYHKSIIKSKKAMTYEEAQLIIDDEAEQGDIAESLRNLNKLAKVLKQRRIEKGALVLASPEIRFQFDSETQDPIEVEVKKIHETNSMVEEFMLLANISVAETIESKFPEFAMLRRHPEPPQTNFDPLIKAGKHLGFDIDTTSGKKLAESLDKAVRKANPYFNTMLRILATRCMMQGVYFISGMVQKEKYFHYGLAVPIYTHFTSPIRRYADIIVHRLLASCIDGADRTDPLYEQKSADLCNELNYRNRMAQYASRASVGLNMHLFLRGRTQEENGYILAVRKNALQIFIPKFGLEGTIYLSDKQNEFVFDGEDHTQHYKDMIFRAFDPVIIRLSMDATNVKREKIVFKLVKPFIAGISVEPMKTDTGDEQLPINRKANESTTACEPSKATKI